MVDDSFFQEQLGRIDVQHLEGGSDEDAALAAMIEHYRQKQPRADEYAIRSDVHRAAATERLRLRKEGKYPRK